MKHCPADLMKVARNNGGLIDIPISDMYANWLKVLKPFMRHLTYDINELRQIPLGAIITSKHKVLSGKLLLSN